MAVVDERRAGLARLTARMPIPEGWRPPGSAPPRPIGRGCSTPAPASAGARGPVTVMHSGLHRAARALRGAVAAIVGALESAELQRRDEALLAPLTGLLIRKALDIRFAELSGQAALTGGRVALVVLDVD